MIKKDKASIARQLFVKQHKSQKEIARLTGVTEQTVCAWVKKFNWKEERDAHLNGSAQTVKDIRKVLSDLAQRRIELGKLQEKAAKDEDTETLRKLNKSAAAISDETSKWNKTLQQLEGRNHLPLSLYIEIVTDIFNAMMKEDEALHFKTIDFQERHLQEVCKRLG